ncbi:hypothetical protein IC582_029899 [Cucumis melo]|uniref:Uncharacterized protein LOC103499929 n=2 Tax=Cucumis melo TaxID=3656 RepID=A0A1S3CEX3_CUCME|nr:uncharacterized protein LOC103499929 [Cucumis melo]TYJ99013.1 uncharacterized protein E5676_scaffold248G002170 [Cucumis melo var. makuwa]
MKRALWGAVFNVCSRTLSVSPPLRTFRSVPLLSPFSVFTLRCYSSGNDKYNELNSTKNKDSLVDDDVSTEELKRKIDKFYEGGDADSLPEIFEAILKRKLSGKHEDADDELMKEIRQRMPGEIEDFKGEEYDSELTDDAASDSEEEDKRI